MATPNLPRPPPCPGCALSSGRSDLPARFPHIRPREPQGRAYLDAAAIQDGEQCAPLGCRLRVHDASHFPELIECDRRPFPGRPTAAIGLRGKWPLTRVTCGRLGITGHQLRDSRHSWAVRAAKAGTPAEIIARPHATRLLAHAGGRVASRSKAASTGTYDGHRHRGGVRGPIAERPVEVHAPAVGQRIHRLAAGVAGTRA